MKFVHLVFFFYVKLSERIFEWQTAVFFHAFPVVVDDLHALNFGIS